MEFSSTGSQLGLRRESFSCMRLPLILLWESHTTTVLGTLMDLDVVWIREERMENF